MRHGRSRLVVTMGALLTIGSMPLRAQLHAALEHEDEPRNDTTDAQTPSPPHATHDADEAPLPASDHVPPAPPQHAMPDMVAAQMVDVMQMDDTARFGMLSIDRLERVKGDDGWATDWSAQAWYGGDRDRLWLRSEGESSRGRVEHADVQAFWSHAFAPYWDWQAGVRHDVGIGADRTWAAFGVAGIAPYWFDVEATIYVGEQGRSALRFESGYDVQLTQRLILRPRVELNAYGRSDPSARIGAGLSDAELGVRLRYEITRRFAPYIGVERRQRFGPTAGFAREVGESDVETQWVAGVHVWF